MPDEPTDDYYVLLGVKADADEQELRRAWRRLAVRYHPDRAGDVATRIFQQISAAYAVLSDPLARAAYDRRRRGAPAAPSRATTAAPAASTSSPPARSSAPAVMLSRLTGALATLLACGAAQIGEDDPPGVITLVLNQAEAAQGGMVRVSLPVDLWCPNCTTMTADGVTQPRPASVTCARCGGRRTVEELYSAWLAIRPGVTPGEELQPSAELPGMVQPIRFRVQFTQPRHPPH